VTPQAIAHRNLHARHVGLAGALALAALLVACVAPPRPPAQKYVPPASGASAKLVMRGTVPAGERYGIFTFDDAEKCTGLRTIGMGDSTRHPQSTVLGANRITTVEFVLAKPNKTLCTVQWTFTPLAGKTYLVRGASVASGCNASVLDASDPDNIKPEPAALRRNPGTGHCLPLAQSRAGSVAGQDGAQRSSDAVLRQGAGAEDLQGLIGQ
jgi:hypothetical protein